jgi:hypothetical protein
MDFNYNHLLTKTIITKIKNFLFSIFHYKNLRQIKNLFCFPIKQWDGAPPLQIEKPESDQLAR